MACNRGFFFYICMYYITFWKCVDIIRGVKHKYLLLVYKSLFLVRLTPLI